jgi:carboxyl-terminal processing protease
MTKRMLPLGGFVLVLAASLAGGYLQSRPAARTANSESNLPDHRSFGFEEALDSVQENYAGRADLERLGQYSIQGMLQQLDPHSSFFTKTQFDELQTETNSRIYGIGVTIIRRQDRVYIISATPGAPGHKAGLRYGDAIISIDGQNVKDWTTEQVMHRVRGEKGETVELTVERAGIPDPLTVRIRRDEVRLPTVRNAFMVGQGGIGYIALTGGFSSKTDEELTTAMTRLKQEGMRHMILDLRGNPGGLLDQAVEVAQKFLPPGEKIVEVRGREDRYTPRVYEVPDNNIPETMPMVILIDRRSASASEVVAGALQDHDRALIVGENSFGKGLVQSVNKVWGGAGLTLTVAKYYTPTGRSIQRDYSSISFYDYYLKRNEEGQATSPNARGDALRTDLGRAVYGGGGIAPDIEVKSPESGALRGRLLYGIFDFVRQLVAGQVAGFREYRIAETQSRKELSAEDINRYPITEPLVAALRQHISAKQQFSVSDEQFDSNISYVQNWMRREVLTAAYGPEAGEQTYLSEDIQLKKAIESLDQARMLADNARRARADRQ